MQGLHNAASGVLISGHYAPAGPGECCLLKTSGRTAAQFVFPSFVAYPEVTRMARNDWISKPSELKVIALDVNV